MWSDQLPFFFTYYGGAMVVGLLLVALVAMASQIEIFLGRWFVPAIPALIALGIASSSVLSGRNLLYAEKHIELLSMGSGSGGWVLRIFTVLILSIAFARILSAAARARTLEAAAGTPLFIALACYAFANVVLPSAFGRHPAFVHSMFYSMIIFTAAWVARRENIVRSVAWAKHSLTLFLMIPSILLLLVPASSIHNIVSEPYRGFIPFVGFRLWGLGSNPNSIGPLALLVLLLEYLQPTRWRQWFWGPKLDLWGFLIARRLPQASSSPLQSMMRRAYIVLPAVLVLILAQSKTAWVAALVAAFILVWYRIAETRSSSARIAIVLVIMLCVMAAGIAFIAMDPMVLWEKLTASKVGENLATASGRTEIWRVAINEWLRSPIFGYGPGIWGPMFRIEVGMQFAFSAHNQFLHSLAGAGTVGFLALIVYLSFAARAAFRVARATRGVSVALLAMILLRCLTETPLSMNGLLDGDVLTHLIFFIVILRAGQTEPAASPVWAPNPGYALGLGGKAPA